MLKNFYEFYSPSDWSACRKENCPGQQLFCKWSGSSWWTGLLQRGQSSEPMFYLQIFRTIWLSSDGLASCKEDFAIYSFWVCSTRIYISNPNQLLFPVKSSRLTASLIFAWWWLRNLEICISWQAMRGDGSWFPAHPPLASCHNPTLCCILIPNQYLHILNNSIFPFGILTVV